VSAKVIRNDHEISESVLRLDDGRELDRNVPVTHGRRMAAAIADCRTHFISDSGHYLVFDEWGVILASITEQDQSRPARA
jgi:pimeloyl-ACP methyl ester carboxylesterase